MSEPRCSGRLNSVLFPSVVADNVRKGAALDAVQIAEALVSRRALYPPARMVSAECWHAKPRGTVEHGGNRIERCINRLENAGRVARRHDKAAVQLTAIRLWIK